MEATEGHQGRNCSLDTTGRWRQGCNLETRPCRSCRAPTLATTSVADLTPSFATDRFVHRDHLLGLELVRMAVTEEGRHCQTKTAALDVDNSDLSNYALRPMTLGVGLDRGYVR